MVQVTLNVGRKPKGVFCPWGFCPTTSNCHLCGLKSCFLIIKFFYSLTIRAVFLYEISYTIFYLTYFFNVWFV